jgi:hypothetical protein
MQSAYVFRTSGQWLSFKQMRLSAPGLNADNLLLLDKVFVKA